MRNAELDAAASVFTTGEAAKICKVSQQTIIRCFDNGQGLKGFRVVRQPAGAARAARPTVRAGMKDWRHPQMAELESGNRKSQSSTTIRSWSTCWSVFSKCCLRAGNLAATSRRPSGRLRWCACSSWNVGVSVSACGDGVAFGSSEVGMRGVLEPGMRKTSIRIIFLARFCAPITIVLLGFDDMAS